MILEGFSLKGLKKMFKLMIILIFIIAIVLVFFSVQYPIGYRDLIVKNSKEYDLDPYLVASIINVESSYDSNAVSIKEAKGLMQISPQTGKWASEVLKIEGYKEEMLFDPTLNIKIGTWYLNRLFKEFNEDLDLTLMAYNAGSGNVNKWLNNKEYCQDGVNINNIPFKETENYLKRIDKNYKVYKGMYGKILKDKEDNNLYINLINKIRSKIKTMID